MAYLRNSSLYLYLLGNMFTTNIDADQRGERLFRRALRSHAGNWPSGQAAQFGEEVNQPLLACYRLRQCQDTRGVRGTQPQN